MMGIEPPWSSRRSRTEEGGHDQRQETSEPDGGTATLWYCSTNSSETYHKNPSHRSIDGDRDLNGTETRQGTVVYMYSKVSTLLRDLLTLYLHLTSHAMLATLADHKQFISIQKLSRLAASS